MPKDVASPADEALLRDLLRDAALCCDARLLPPDSEHPRWRVLGDPTEAALLVAAAKLGLFRERLAEWTRLAELPFDSSRRRMTTVQDFGGQAVACVKGAPSELLPRSISLVTRHGSRPLDDAGRAAAQDAAEALARRGLRVLAVATRRLDGGPPLVGWQVAEVEQSLELLGFVAMEDPPRAEVPAAIAACRAAGVRVIMATGDSGLTGAAIGREIGLCDERARVITGAQLQSLSDAALDHALESPQVLFARAAPEHKLRLVEALQRRGHVVAVTGDGVNDAPALRRADIGVAMGVSGTDVAREAADIVLADDNFASIVAAIEEGRAVFDNIRKFFTYILASNVPEAVPVVLFVLLKVPLPLTVMQILAVDLGTDLLPALALGAEPPEPRVMQRPPRSRHERLIDGPTLWRAYAWLGLWEAGLSFAAYLAAQAWAGWRWGMPLFAEGEAYRVATTMSLAGIVAAQIGNVFVCRVGQGSVLAGMRRGNRLLLVGIAAELVVLALLIYVPPLARLFALAPLGPAHWALLATFPAVMIAAEQARRG